MSESPKMVLKIVPRLSWICLLLCSYGSGYPYPQQVASGGSAGGSGPGIPGMGSYFGGSGSNYYYGPGSDYGVGGAGSSTGFAGGAGSSMGGTGPGRGGAGLGSGVDGAGSGSTTGVGPGMGAAGSRGPGSGGTERTGSGFPVFQAFPWNHQFVMVPPSFNFHHLRLAPFPSGNPWDTNEVPLGSIEVPPAPPSSHIVQTSNGYQRARSVMSHSKYSPDDWDTFPIPSGKDQDGGPVKGQMS